VKKDKGISKAFLIFLVISIGIWLLTTLSKSYNTTIAFPLKYQELSQNRLLKNEPLQSINIEINATGFKILACKFVTNPILLQTDRLRKKTGDLYYFLPRLQKNAIVKQLPSQLQSVEILQDTIYMKIGVLATKKVAVKPSVNLNFKVGYDLLGDIKLVPDSIKISGTKSKLDVINSVQLENIELNQVYEDFSKEIAVKKDTLYAGVKFDTKTVLVSGKVEQFTEGSVEIPFEITNATKSEKEELTTLTKNVKVTFVVGLSDFESITETDFIVVCDYSMAKENNLNYLIPKLIAKPAQIKSYTITPNTIDFLIQKEL
jgi:hypothetical protein